MTTETNQKGMNRLIIVRFGLLVVGLLAGILVTLLVTRSGELVIPRPAIVERVELGNPDRTAFIQLPESDTPPVLFDASSLNEAFKYVAAQVTPSVVFIEVQSERTGIFRSFGKRDQPTFVPRSVGSGVIISGSGYVVTNNHVIEGADQILVTLQDKREFEASVVGTDTDTDLAVLKLESVEPLPSIHLGISRELEVGEWVIAVGNPFRLTSTVTAGIVSALGRQVEVINDDFGIESFIQTDAAINPGNSGGALVNLRGELIGISTAIATETGSYEGYGFAVPVDLMERVVSDLIKFGEVNRGYLGVSIMPLDASSARDLGLSNVRGVYLYDVVDGLAGDVAGLRDGDVLLSIDGQEVSEPNELQSAIALHRPGEEFLVEIWRDQVTMEFPVQLVGRDDPRYQTWFASLEARRNDQVRVEPDFTPPGVDVQNLEKWGVGLAQLDARIRGRFSVPHGTYVAFVEKDGPFNKAGVPRNVLLTAIDDKPVHDVEGAAEILEMALQNAESVMLRVTRSDGVSLFFEVDVPQQ
ncbi:MAG: trypsin-like peptidase domain-containing protein [Rhodothermia bacterium]|nr:MAG: trypsin-like peptidase domain-containing protein [Rhodothermia bacterium]